MSAVSETRPNLPYVLFVDDSRLMRACATRILGREFNLVLAESAETAWEMLQTDRRIQAVFTDLHMTGKSGMDLLKQLRSAESPHLSDLPLVLITGEEDGEKRRQSALALGATDFISKPFQASELTARARAYAETTESTRRLRLLEQAHHVDAESGLGNRRYCEERLLQAMSFAHRHRQPLAMMHLRLDGLERLLQDLGEPHAGRALQRIGRTLRQRIRNEDTVFRTGPQTFSFLLPGTSAEGAERLKSRFLPDLDELGLDSPEQGLHVRAGFVIQTPPAPNGRDIGSILDEGLSGRPTAMRPGSDAQAPGIERALRMIERGQEAELQPFLAELEERLKPLLQLFESRRGQPRSGMAHPRHRFD